MKIALIAHDRKKELMLKLAIAYQPILKNIHCMQQELRDAK